MKGDQENIKQALGDVGSKVAKKLSPENVEAAHNIAQSAQASSRHIFEKATGRAVKDGTTVKDALGLTDAMIEGIYGQAYRLYNTGKFKDASQIFRMLVMLNSNDPRYLMGLAACHHMMKDYLSAINTYTVCSMIDGDNPVPLYHASDCMIQVGDHASALIVLEMAVDRAGDKPEYKTLKDRALLTIENLKKEVAKLTAK